MMRIAVRPLFFLMLFLSIVHSNLALGADSRYIRRIESSQSVIVFIHGILGDGTSTWTADNKSYWPEMLTRDTYFKSFDIYVYEYPTSFLNAPFSIDEIAENMRLFFDVDGVTAHKDVIFIAHSMGGLATRAYLLKNRDVASRTRLIYFFSTPTTGSEIASLASLVSANPQLAKMRPMRSADYLADLERQWLAANLNIPSFCGYETKKTYGISVVTQASASNLCNKRLDPVDADHITSVKPSNDRAVSYLAFKSAVMQTPSLSGNQLQKDTIKKSEILWNHKDVLDTKDYLGRDETNIHIALLTVYIEFLDSHFNNELFFQSFDSFEANIQNIGMNEWSKVKTGFRDCAESMTRRLKCLGVLKFADEPQVGASLELKVGPITKRHVITAATFTWEAIKHDEYDKANPWWVAASDVLYEVDRPTWMVVSNAEILKGGDGILLLRATVTNPTDLSASLSRIYVFARYPFDSGTTCDTGDPVQVANLKWEKIITGKPAAATTTLKGSEIPVEVRYNSLGICSGGYSFSADIRISESVESRTEKQIFLKLKQMPGVVAKRPSKLIKTGPPQDLSQWPLLQLSIAPAAGTLLKPTTIDIRK
jgi:pimeloyl-ACP methyl ester carboxylesterase